MAVEPVLVRIPTLTQAEPVVDAQMKPTNYFLRTLNGILKTLAEAIRQLQQLPIIQDALEQLDLATQAATEAAAAASQAAADSMDAAAASAAATAANAREASLQASYIDPSSVLTATPTTITIAPHNRIYPGAAGGPATTVAVNGGSIAATAPADVDYIFYSDPTRAGGAVTYQVSTTPPVQTGSTHVVGAVEIPATGTADGGEGPRRPGAVSPRTQLE